MKRDGEIGQREFSANHNSCDCTGWLPSGLADGRPWEFGGAKQKEAKGLLPFLPGFTVCPPWLQYKPLPVRVTGGLVPGLWKSWFLSLPPSLGTAAALAVPDLWVALPSAPWVSQLCHQHNQFPTLNPLCFKYLSMVSVFLVGRQLLYS